MATDAKADDKVIEQARERYDRGWQRERRNQAEAYYDLKFRRGHKEDQWDPEALKVRKDRPALTINEIPAFIRQVTGDQRQSRPAIRVIPVDNGADVETAKVLTDLCRYVENRSYAKHVYTTAGDSQVACGIGHWQVGTEYANSSTFNQEIRISGIEDGVAVIWDPDSVLPTREDAMWCFVPVDVSRSAFKERWPDKVPADFSFTGTMSESFSIWSGDDFIRVAQYWVKEPVQRTLALLADGSIDDLTDSLGDAGSEQSAQALAWYEANGARIERRDSFKVYRYLITQSDVLERAEWPGMHIPIVPVIGEEVRIGREVYRHGIVRYARDPQRMLNYYASADAEVVALQPKAPYIATIKQVQNHMDLWGSANTDNFPVLIYDADPQAPGKPERVAPPQGSAAIQAGRLQAYQDMKSVIGIYDAGLGARSNETSGVAIAARDRQSDTGTFVYHDNLALAVQRTGQIIVDLIPHIYDTQRVIRIMGEDGKLSAIEINKPVIEGGLEKVMNDLTVGSYDVVVEMGPNYATKRQEARDSMNEFIRAFPPAAGVIGDLVAKAQDWPNAQEIGERLEEILPPPIKAKLRQEKQATQQAAGQNPQPDPEQQAAAQQQAEAAQMRQAEIAAAMAKLQAEVQESQAKARAAEANAEKAETELQIKLAELHGKRMGITHQDERHRFEIAKEIDDHNAGHAREQQRHDATLEKMNRPVEGQAAVQ
jgi:hypothetical protein